jgi:hypothetical protein
VSVRRATLSAALALAALALGALPVSTAGAQKPPPVYVGSKGDYVRATLGSYCYTDELSGNQQVSACADAFYPLPVNGQLQVVPRQRLRVDAGRRVIRLGASLVRVEGNEVTYLGSVRKRRTGQGRFWRLRLPADLGSANILSLDLDFGNVGDSNVWAGLAVAGGP